MKYVLIVLLFLVGCSKSTDELQTELIAVNTEHIGNVLKIISIQSETIFSLNEHMIRIDKEIKLLKEERR